MQTAVLTFFKLLCIPPPKTPDAGKREFKSQLTGPTWNHTGKWDCQCTSDLESDSDKPLGLGCPGKFSELPDCQPERQWQWPWQQLRRRDSTSQWLKVRRARLQIHRALPVAAARAGPAWGWAAGWRTLAASVSERPGYCRAGHEHSRAARASCYRVSQSPPPGGAR